MTANLDRFDRALLGIGVQAPLERQPVITSSRPPRFVDHMTCPLCGTEREGIEYHGELRSGAKVHTLGAHSVGRRRVGNREPRCLGSGIRIVFEGGIWKGAPS